MLEKCVKQDLRAGRGLLYIDPHGDSAKKIYSWAPDYIQENIIYLDFSRDSPWGINPLRKCPPEYRSLLVSGLLEVFKKQWGDGKNWGAKMEHILRNGIATLVCADGAELSDLQKIYTDDDFVESLLPSISSESVRNFWQKEWNGYSSRQKQDSFAPIANKLGAFLSNDIVADFVSKDRKQLSLRNVMDNGKAVVVNLAKGRIGSDASNLLGGFLLTLVALAAYSRENVSEDNRRAFFCYLDEFQNITPQSLVEGLSELRKYKIGFILAHQYVEQLSKELKDSVLGNAGTIISFRLGASDARTLAPELKPVFDPLDLVRLPNYQYCIKLAIDGKPCRGFTGYSAKLGNNSGYAR